MEAKELRIGNTVSLENEIMTVNASLIKLFEKSEFIGYDTSDLQPISITKERLFDLGFKSKNVKIDKYFTVTDIFLPIANDVSIHLSKVTSSDLWDIYINQKQGRRKVIILLDRQIKYLHEVQNFCYEMSGEELTLKS